MADPQVLIEQYLANELTQAEHAELARWLLADESNRQAFLAEIDFYRTVRGVLIEEQHDLARNAEDDDASLFDAPLPIIHIDDDKLTTEQYLSALSYLTRHIFTPKHVAILATAAALLLGVALTIVMLYGPDESAPIVQQIGDNNTQPKPAASEQSTPRASTPGITPVATLTAQHNAVWADRVLARGSELKPSQRLTLTAGFAEITTNDGAIVILEAPATVELLDSDNALRLVHGNMVGICETESSKGLWVSTPHAAVIDLSTRFGVQVTLGTTEVHVIEGSVEVRQAKAEGSSDFTSIRMAAGESVRAGQGDILEAIDHDLSGFASLQPVVTPLRATGPGLGIGEIDPAWQIIAVDDHTFTKPIPMTVANSDALVKHFPNHRERVQWLAADPPEDELGITRYVIRTTLQLPDDVDPDSAVIHMRYVVDNLLKSTRVNGITLDVAGDVPESEYVKKEFSEQHAFAIDRGLVAGENTIEFEVIDFVKAVGLRLEWELHQPWIDMAVKP